jgi:hypothetical protein
MIDAGAACLWRVSLSQTQFSDVSLALILRFISLGNAYFWKTKIHNGIRDAFLSFYPSLLFELFKERERSICVAFLE